MNKTLIIVSNIQDYYFSILKSCDVVSILGDNRINSLRICKYIPIIVEKKIIKKIKINKYTNIIIFDTPFFYLPNLPKTIKKHFPNVILNLYFWNMVSDKIKAQFDNLKFFNRIFSFSKKDSLEYGFIYRDLMVEKFDIKNSNMQHDFFFLGYKKNRFAKIRSLSSLLKKYMTKFIVVGDKEDCNDDNIVFLKHEMKYKEYIGFLVNSVCIIDIPNDKQDGYTIRVAEAVLYKKKLITTNMSILEEKFYNSNNIFVYNEQTTIAEIDEFFKKPLIDYEYSEHFKFENWLKEMELNNDAHEKNI